MNHSISPGLNNIESWRYKAEGNASLVISHSKDHRILKLCKCPVEPEKDKEYEANVSESDLKGQLQYVKNIIKPLLGAYVCLPELVPVTPGFVKSINERFDKLRPRHRLHKMADPRCSVAVSLPDLSFLHPSEEGCDKPTFCVEIKPKMGFITKSPWIRPERAVKKSVCRYCLLQRLKVKRGDCSEVNAYCPIDLFSGNIPRMKYALRSLLDNPQNNMRIFKNGKCLYASQGGTKPSDDERMLLYDNLVDYFGTLDIEEDSKCDKPLQSHVIDSFLDVVIKVLKHEKDETPDSKQERRPVQTCEASCFDATTTAVHSQESSSIQLPPGCVLDVLLETQMLDDLDIEGVLPLYEKITQAMRGEVCEREQFQLDWPFDEKEFHQQMTRTSDDPVTVETLDTVSTATLVHKLRCFLVSGTAKDCSILVAIQPVSKNKRLRHHPRLFYHGNHTYAHSCHIIDLDPKPAGRITKYHNFDTEIVDHFISTQM